MPSQARSTWSPLYYGLFRALWISSTASHIGSYMTDVGQGWLMSSLTPSPLIVSLLLTAESLPFFLFGLPAGALADIIDRRRLLIVSQLAMAITVGTLAILSFAGLVTPWILLVLAFVLGIASAFNDPAWHAVIPELLPKEELGAGITLSGVSVNVARTLGPAIGGFVVAAAIATRPSRYISLHALRSWCDGTNACPRARDRFRRPRVRSVARLARSRSGDRGGALIPFSLPACTRNGGRCRIWRIRSSGHRRGADTRAFPALSDHVHRRCRLAFRALDLHGRRSGGEPSLGASARNGDISHGFSSGNRRRERAVGRGGISRWAKRGLLWYCWRISSWSGACAAPETGRRRSC